MHKPAVRFTSLFVALALAGCVIPAGLVIDRVPTPKGSKAPPNTGSPSPETEESEAPPTDSTAQPSPKPTTRKSIRPTTAPSIYPSTIGWTVPNATPTPGWNYPPSVYPSYPPPQGRTTILSGNVYDEEGATVDGALIMVKSLDASVPYAATATTSSGSWVVNNVPEGANVEIVATKDGWTLRRRVGAFQVPDQSAANGPMRNIVNFGGPPAADDTYAVGSAYFISDYPEVERTEPYSDATGVDPSKVTYKLRLSEPLDEDSRDALDAALRLWPANAEAGAPGAKDLESFENADLGDGLAGLGLNFNQTPLPAAIGYVIKKGSMFLDDTTIRATPTWDAEGREVTFTFNAPLIANNNDEAKYQIGLVSGGDQIEDEDGNQLGTDHAGSLRNYPLAGRLIANAFREVDLSLSRDANGGVASAEASWAGTHDSFSNFEVRRDERDPKLVAVDYTNVGNDARIELTFSEAMVAFDGTVQGRSSGTLTGDDNHDGTAETAAVLSNFMFAVGDKSGDLDDVNLESNSQTLEIDPRVAAIVGDTANELEQAFVLAPGALQLNGNLGAASTGQVVIEVDPKNPSTVFLWIKGRAGFFASVASTFKARVEGVSDPAGNAISEADADQNQVQGSL